MIESADTILSVSIRSVPGLLESASRNSVSSELSGIHIGTSSTKTWSHSAMPVPGILKSQEKHFMSLNKPVRRIAIVGTGVIGASWAAQYLARGFDVIATDPAPGAEANLRHYVEEAWPTLTDIGLSPGATRDRLAFTSNMKDALSKADFVQENGPERPDFKIKLFAEIDDATPPDSIIASSSSGITMTVIQSGCKRPERCVIGHPFNRPKQSNRQWPFIRRSVKSRSICERPFPAMSRTGSRQRSIERSFI